MQVNQVSAQTLIFLYSVALGGVFGIIYDIFRLIRISLSAKKYLTAVFDVLYFALITLIFFWFSMNIGQGATRLFHIIGAALGLVLYLVTIGLVMGKIMRFVISKIKWVLCLIFKPFAMIFKFIWNKTENIRKKPAELLKKIKKNFKILLQPKPKI